MIGRFFYIGLAFIIVAIVQSPAQAKTAAPTIIAHRGASGYLPEHTLEAYSLAIDMGADYIEPDLVATKDGVLVVRHEPMLSGTTDIEGRPEFAKRRRTVKFEGTEITDWFVSDFTLAEIKTLRAKQAFPERDQSHNGKYQIATFEDVIALVKSKSQAKGRVIGIAPETKHPTLHKMMGLPLEDKLVAALETAGWNGAEAPVIIQSFETDNLKYLRTKTKVKLAQLVDGGDIDPKTGAIIPSGLSARPYDWTLAGRKGTYGDLLTPEGLDEIATYADIVAPWKPYLLITKATIGADGKPVDINKDGKIDQRDFTATPDDRIVKAAHMRGLKVVTWTLRDEATRLAANYGGQALKEYHDLFAIGVDGVFSDFPDTAVKARADYLSRK